MIFHDYPGFFKFHDFSMYGTLFGDFPGFSMISRACENPVECWVIFHALAS